jgi:Holliday junction resolvase-like predicted endonuclease
VKVKHRHEATYGDSLDAITKKKLNQVKFAVELWHKKFSHSGDAQLSVIATTGTSPIVTE